MYENIMETNLSKYEKKETEIKKQIIVESLKIRNSTSLEKNVRRELVRHGSQNRAVKKIEIAKNIKPFSPRRKLNVSKSNEISKTYRNANILKTY